MRRARTAVAAAALVALTLAGCASADKHSGSGASSSSGSSMQMSGSSGSSGSASSGTGSAGAVAGSDSMPGMSSGTATIVNAKGVPVPVPVKTIASGDWNEMKIQAQEMTPVPFYVYNGTSFSEVKPTRATSFHLMVMLSDKLTGVALPYATVWAQIYRDSKLVYNERQWDMLSEYMGPHYGNDVALPGSGTYKLKLLISAPVAALHQEYDKMWVGTHTLTSSFTWDGQTQSAQ